MRKLLLILTAICFFANTFAVTIPVKPPKLKATEVYLTIGKEGERVSLFDISRMNIKELQSVTSKKMKFFDRLGFKVAQRKLRQSINHDGTFNSKKLQKFFSKREMSGETGFHLGGFALGILLGLIGVLIAYLINDDKKANRTKWAWIGLGVVVVIALLTLI